MELGAVKLQRSKVGWELGLAVDRSHGSSLRLPAKLHHWEGPMRPRVYEVAAMNDPTLHYQEKGSACASLSLRIEHHYCRVLMSDPRKLCHWRISVAMTFVCRETLHVNTNLIYHRSGVHTTRNRRKNAMRGIAIASVQLKIFLDLSIALLTGFERRVHQPILSALLSLDIPSSTVSVLFVPNSELRNEFAFRSHVVKKTMGFGVRACYSAL